VILAWSSLLFSSALFLINTRSVAKGWAGWFHSLLSAPPPAGKWAQIGNATDVSLAHNAFYIFFHDDNNGVRLVRGQVAERTRTCLRGINFFRVNTHPGGG